MKGLFQSKIFWSAFAIFAATVTKVVSGFDINSDIIVQVINLDWTNWVVALGSAITMILRYFSETKISGLWQATKESSDEFDAK